MLYVDTTLDTAIDRNVKRGAKGGRRLRDEDLIRSWSAVNRNKEPYQDLFGENIVIVDGNTFDPKEISRQSKIIQKISRVYLSKYILPFIYKLNRKQAKF